MKKFIMYGAGNIGRGFIGQVFSNAGYSVGFVDINQEVINKLNSDKEYPVNVVSNEGIEEKIVKNVYGIDGTDVDLVASEIASADLMATAIGVNVLKFIAKPIAMGLKKRFENGNKPLNIIICENLIGADKYLKGLIVEQIPEYKDKIEQEVGFVEASIGRMVPVVPEEKKFGNVLRVYVEPYDILPVDSSAFKGEVPKCDNLYPYSPFEMFIQRKLFMHNMSHATCAYLGFLKGLNYIYQAIDDVCIKYIARKCLTESALAISKEHGIDIKDLLLHADNLVYRFKNVELGDTVERVGKDTIRKLSNNDRLIGAMLLAEKHNLPCEFLCVSVAAAMLFNPQSDDRSIEIYNFTKEHGVRETLNKYCGYNGKKVIVIEKLYDMLSSGISFNEVINYVEEIAGKKIGV